MKYTIVFYQLPNGRIPVRQFIDSVKDQNLARRLLNRLERVEAGNLGDSKSVGNGVYELRFAFGPGYRIYFALEAGAVVLLLCGGDKGTQKHDIELAKTYVEDHRRRSEEH